MHKIPKLLLRDLKE